MDRNLWLEKALAAVLVRVVWFVGMFVFLLFVSWRSLVDFVYLSEPLSLVMGLAAVSAFVALIGPIALTRARYRASGKLAQIRARSEMPGNDEAKKQIRVARPRR